VLRDVKGGYVSVNVARDHYGVAVTADATVDDKAMQRLRKNPIAQ
jgi:hypothetical protein